MDIMISGSRSRRRLPSNIMNTGSLNKSNLSQYALYPRLDIVPASLILMFFLDPADLSILKLLNILHKLRIWERSNLFKC
jgi:hypothetical protein